MAASESTGLQPISIREVYWGLDCIGFKNYINFGSGTDNKWH